MTKTSWLMLSREITSFNRECNAKHINTWYGSNKYFLNVNCGGTYCYH